MSIIVPLIMLFVCSFVPVFGYALYRSWRLVQLEQFLEMSKPSGQSNTALIKLMQSIEREIENRSEYRAIPGYTAQEVADGLQLMASAGTSVSDYQQEECSFTQYTDDGFALVLPVEVQ